MSEKVWKVQSYKKMPLIVVLEIPQYFKLLLPSMLSSSLLSSPSNLQESPYTTFLSPLGSPFDVLMDGSSQPQLRQSQQSDEQKLVYKFEQMEVLLKDSGFNSVGEILGVLFYNPTHISGESDPWDSFHAKAMSRFLQGCNRIKMSDIIVLIYGHKHSAPSPSSPLYSEHHSPFSPSVSPAEIFHTCPSLFSWETNLVATHIHQEIHQLSCTNVPGGENHLCASMNGCCLDHFKLVTWQALGKLNISALCEKYKVHTPVSWYSCRQTKPSNLLTDFLGLRKASELVYNGINGFLLISFINSNQQNFQKWWFKGFIPPKFGTCLKK